MAGIAAAADRTIARAWTRAIRRCAGLLAALVLAAATPAQAQGVRGEATMAVAGGYARIVL